MPAHATVTLHLMTDESRVTRPGFEKFPKPYTKILSIATTPPQGGTDKTLDLPVELAGRLINYHNRYYNDEGEQVDEENEVNCAHFARFMCGHLDPSWDVAMLNLDGVEGAITPIRKLPAYHLGVIASSKAFRDSKVGYEHFLHGGIGLSGEWEGHFLNISGLGGNLAIISAQAVLDYNRKRVPGWYGLEPSDLHLYDRGEVLPAIHGITVRGHFNPLC